MDEKENMDAKFLICKSGDLLLARRSQRLRRAGGLIWNIQLFLNDEIRSN